MKKQITFIFTITCLVAVFFLTQNQTISIVNAAQPSAEIVSVENVSFNRDIYPLVERRCVKCHGGKFPSEGLSMESYQALMQGSQNGTVIVAGDANNSLLFEKVESGKMPKRGADLTAQEIELIRQWINEGALNN